MNYEKLIKDIREGKFDVEKYELIFDNDGGYWNTVDAEDDFVRDAEHGRLRKEYGSPNGYRDLVDLARAAGIPADWC